MKKLLFLIPFLCIAFLSQAQILGKILNRTQDKISREISDRVVERISDEIARAAMKPIDKAIDDMLQERYKQDSIDGKTGSKDYSEFLAAFMVPVELPDAYTFDMTLRAKTKSYEGDKSEMELLLTENGSSIGMRQFEDNKNTLMVFDMENNIMAIYSEGENGKEVTAMPSMLSAAGKVVMNEHEDEEYKMTVEKTGNTKKIKGYKCDEWLIEDEETETKAFVAKDFPISWQDSFSQFMKEMMPTSRRNEMPSGMVLKSKTKTKKKNKKTEFEVIDINDSPSTIDNSEYTLINYQDQNN